MRRPGRRDRLLQERRHDTYQERAKLPEPTVCSGCRALFVDGRWCWKAAPETAHQAICPACRRIADDFPAGFVEIKGPFFQEHRKEILNLIRNLEAREKSDRPLERLMRMKKEAGQTLITTTGIHLARRIGEALARSYNGDLSYQYGDGEQSIRVYWER